MNKSRVLIATSRLLCVLLATACSGDHGRDGKDGANGRDGGAGKDGVNGEAGKQGPPGKDGTNGKDGGAGKPGAPGKDGKDGVNGEPGKDGANGGQDGGADAGNDGRPPNILFIMADDLGYSDIHAFGGEIDTPNLDALIADGRILTNHHAGTVSAITRSMLISGTDHHLVGEGTMGAPTDERKGLPGYEGYLNDSSLSVAELLKDAGYHTYIAGKWHLGSAVAGATTGGGKTPDQWGFEHSFSLLGGAASNHFTHEVAGSKNFVLDGAYAQPGQPNQKSGYSTDLYTDTLIGFIDGNHGDGKPFFAYAAYTSPHWPLQVPEPWLSKYKGRYDQGYDSVRAARIQRQHDSGLVPQSWTSFPGAPETLVASPATAGYGTPGGKSISAVHFPDDGYVDYRAGFVDKKWSSLTDLEKKAQARYMEVYAGMVSNLDWNVGRLIQHLQDIGEYDRTFIFFQSDNGAEGWPIDSGADPKATDEANAAPGKYETLGTDNGQQAVPKQQYGLRWAEVSATPFAQVKGLSGEGGVSVPAFVHVPGGQKGPKAPIRNFTHVVDDTATFLAVAGVTPPTTPAPADVDSTTGVDRNKGKVVYKGRYVYPVTGVSLLPQLGALAPNPVHTTPFIDEAYGRAYVFSADGRWKARWTEPPLGPLDGHWELFDIVNDRGESNDVSAEHPDLVTSLRQQWQTSLTAVGGVEPLNPRGFY